MNDTTCQLRVILTCHLDITPKQHITDNLACELYIQNELPVTSHVANRSDYIMISSNTCSANILQVYTERYDIPDNVE